MIEDIKQDAYKRMQKSIEAFKAELSKIRTGRAHPTLLNHVMVDFYGSEVPIGQAANITVEDARTLAVTPWDKSMVPIIEKAIMTSDLGLNPSTAGAVIRVPMPPLTEERRKELVKVVRKDGETWALIVDAVLDFERFDASELQNAQVTVTKSAVHFTNGVVQTPEGPAARIDPERLFEGLGRSLQ